MSRVTAWALVTALAGCAQGTPDRPTGAEDSGVPEDTTTPRDAAPQDLMPPQDSAPQDATPPLDATVTPPDACVPSVTELLVNPTFDLEPAGASWLQISPLGDNLVTTAGFASDSSPYLAWLGSMEADDFFANEISDGIYQDVVVPPMTTKLQFTGRWRVGTIDSTTFPYDYGTIYALTTTNSIIATIKNVDNTMAGGVWEPIDYLLPTSLSGQTIRIYAASTNDIWDYTNFFFDTMSLKATSGCP